jgi:hypothetical protein
VSTVRASTRDISSVDGTRLAPGRRIPEWAVAVGVGGFVAIVMIIPFLLRHDFYYTGDNPESFVPLWHHFGEQLRAGHWPTVDPAGWYGGNYAAEGTYSLWNPVQGLDYVVVSLFDNLAAAAAFVQVQFLALLGIGGYLLCREYGAGRTAAAAVAVGVPMSGFTVYYEAAGWPAGLMAFTWVAWFWWAVRRQARGRLWPVATFLIGALGMTTGNPYAALGMVVVLAGVAVELVVARDHRRVVGLVVTGLCVGGTAALVFLPLVGTLPVTNRETVAFLGNDLFLVPHLGDLLAASAPTYLPAIVNWGGSLFERLPSTYFLWFAIPVLPWLRWDVLRRNGRPPVSLLVITAAFLAMTVGPSNVWLFRWPIRLIEYFYLGGAVLLALALTPGMARDHVRHRTWATVGLVAAEAYLSGAVRPDLYRMHLLAGAGVLALVLAAAWAFRRWGARAAAGLLLLGTVVVLVYQTSHLPVGVGGPTDRAGTPVSIAQVRKATAAYRGTVLQLATEASLGAAPSSRTGELLFGNESLMSGHESIVRYSGMSFQSFSEALCIDYRGVACPEAFDRIWRPMGATGAPLVDLLNVRTLVLDAALFPGPASGPPRPGWTVAAQDSLRTVWVRDLPDRAGGRLSWASPGVEVLRDAGEGTSESVSFHASEAGSLVFARLAWPGYSAAVDGRPVPVQAGPAGLLTVRAPAGDHRLTVTFQPPGLRAGIAVFLAATVLSIAQTAVWVLRRRRRRRRAPAAGDATPPPTVGAGSPADEPVHAGTPAPSRATAPPG